MKFTIVYVNDDGTVSCYGSFTERVSAEPIAERMERDLDDDRDQTGGGVGNVWVCSIQPLSSW